MAGRPQSGGRRGQRGQAMVESVICMLLLALSLFGLLQVFHLYVAQIVFDYSSFCMARSGSVGFADYLLQRSSRVAAIGAGGALVDEADNGYTGDPLSQFAAEKVRIPEYLAGDRYLDYEYFRTENNDYGAYLSCRKANGIDGMADATVTGHNYPLLMPMRATYTTDETLDLQGTAAVKDYSQDFL